MRRLLTALAVLLGLTAFGFAAGGELAASFVIDPGDSLAGAATVAILAVGGAFLGVVAAIVCLARVDPARLGRAARCGSGWRSSTKARVKAGRRG